MGKENGLLPTPRTLEASFHCHTIFSDGHNRVDRSIREARTRLHYFGISDHETIMGWPCLAREVRRVNDQQEEQLIPMFGVEIRTRHGEVVITRPGDYDTGFEDWARRSAGNSRSRPLCRVITEAVEHHGALAIVIHPSLPIIPAVSLYLSWEN